MPSEYDALLTAAPEAAPPDDVKFGSGGGEVFAGFSAPQRPAKKQPSQYDALIPIAQKAKSSQYDPLLQSIRTRGGTLTDDQIPLKDTEESLLSPQAARVLLQANPMMMAGEAMAKFAPKSVAQIYDGAEQGAADILS